jgi:hypothetical protein
LPVRLTAQYAAAASRDRDDRAGRDGLRFASDSITIGFARRLEALLPSAALEAND